MTDRNLPTWERSIPDNNLHLARMMSRTHFLGKVLPILAAVEGHLQALQQKPEDTAKMIRVFKSMHALSCSADFHGFHDFSRLAQEVFLVFQQTANTGGHVSERMVKLTTTALSQLRRMADPAPTDNAEDAKRIITSLLT